MKKYIYTIGVLLSSLTAIAQSYCPPEWIPPGCPPHVPITDPINETGIVFEAANSITASNIIQNGASATYKAGNEITFIEGFDAVSGAALDALIEECVSSIIPPNDPLFCLQWGHYNLGGAIPRYGDGELIGIFNADADILEAWEITEGSPNITVAIMDSGIDIDHPDAITNIDIDEIHPDFDLLRIVEGQNFIAGENASNYTDDCGHGTLVAGILGATAKNNIGLAGVDQQCKIMPLKIVKKVGTNCDPDEAALIQAINYAIHPDRNNNRADIISMSFGLASHSYELEEAMREAIDANVLLLAATGNNNNTNVHYPASHASVMGIGAMSPCNERKSDTSCDLDNRDSSWGSNYGTGLDLVAPGVLLPATDIQGEDGYSQPGNQYTPDGNYLLDIYGTSIATPFAAGVAALVWAAELSLKNYQVRDILQKTATDIGDPTGTGHGSINALAAVEYAQNPPEPFLLLPNLSLEIDAPETVNMGGTLSITYRVVNTGDAPAQPSVLNITGFSNVTIEQPLNGGQWFEETIVIDIVPKCDGGDFIASNYSINFQVDIYNEIEEFNEFNWFRHHFEVVEPGPPDLIVENPVLTPLMPPSKDGNYSLTYDVKNNGLGQAYMQPFSYNFYRYYESADVDLDETDGLPIDSENIENLPLCSQDSISKAVNLNITPGTNYLLIRIDATDAIGESNEDNVFEVPVGMAPINPMEEQPIGIDPVEDPVASAKAKNSGELKESTAELVVSPNPFEESVSFEFYTEQNAKVALSIYDVEGKLQLEKKLSYQEEGKQLIEADLGTLPSGTYVYKLVVDKKPFTGKIIKK